MRRRHTDLTCRHRLGAGGNVPCRRDDVTRTVRRTRVIWQTACTRRGTGLGAVTGSTPARCSTIAVVMLTTDTLRHIAGHQTIATVVQIAVVTTSRWLGSPGDRCRLGCPMATSPGRVRAGLQTCTYANRCSQRLHLMNRATQRTKTGASNHRCLPCDNTIKTISAQTCQVGWPRPLSWPRPVGWPHPVSWPRPVSWRHLVDCPVVFQRLLSCTVLLMCTLHVCSLVCAPCE